MKTNVITLPTSTRHKKKRVDTIELTPEILKKIRSPKFQRPFTMNKNIQDIVEEIRESGVFPGILTLGLYSGDIWTIDGQHRLEAVKLTERKDVLADVHYIECETEEEMAEEFRRLNTALVKFRPDDILRGKELSSLGLQKVRSACKFIGYDNIRRNPSSPILGMSLTLRAWFGSETETPKAAAGSASTLADRLTLDEAQKLVKFLNIAVESWGREKSYHRLWAIPNMTLCMWMYRKLVLEVPVKTKRHTTLTADQFSQCLMALSANSFYLDYIVGRALNDDHRSPMYVRVKGVFNDRLKEEGILRVKFPQPAWASH